VCNCKVNTCKRLIQCYLFLKQKVRTFSLVNFVRLLLHYNHNVTRFNTWILISFTVECILLVIWRTFVNFSLNNFLFFYYFFSLTILALVFLIDNFALTTAIITWTSGLSIHTWSELLHTSYLSPSLACRTFLYCALFTTFSSTRLANSLTINSNFCLFTHHDFF